MVVQVLKASEIFLKDLRKKVKAAIFRCSDLWGKGLSIAWEMNDFEMSET